MIRTDQFGQKYIIRKDFPHLFDQVQDFCRYAYWHSCCIDEALDWINLISAQMMFVTDLEYILNLPRYIDWVNKRNSNNS